MEIALPGISRGSALPFLLQAQVEAHAEQEEHQGKGQAACNRGGPESLQATPQKEDRG